MMKINTKMLFGCLLLAGSALLLGSGMFRRSGAVADARANEVQCRSAARVIVSIVPENARSGWEKIAERSPELVIRAACGPLEHVK